MIFTQAIKMAWKSIVSNKLRSFLTILGIIIGVFSVITLVSLGQGLGNNINNEINKLGTNSLVVNITGRGVRSSLTLEETMAYQQMPNITAVSPVIRGSVKAKNGTKNKDVNLEGIVPEYEVVQNFHVQEGRFIVQADVDRLQKVALLGTNTAKELFGLLSPVGENIIINGVQYKVVGLLETKGSSLAGSNDDKILIPITTSERLLTNPGIRTFTVQVDDRENVSKVSDQLSRDLKKRFATDNSDGFTIFNQQDALDSSASIMTMISAALGGIAGISLLVGGIGIMNIMLVSVTERTREIGIRKAVGARKRDILLQFLIESVLLSASGGIIGIGIGIGATFLLSGILGFTASVSWGIVILAFSFSLFIGVCFGIFPANKAAKLKPIDALRVD